MNKFKEWCKEILPVIQAAANGDAIQASYDCDVWTDKKECGFQMELKYRIKPRTILIGDMEIPEPMREDPPLGGKYFCPVILGAHPCALELQWYGDDGDMYRLANGLCQKTPENAVDHAKALIALTANK